MSGCFRFIAGGLAAGVWLAGMASGFCAETAEPTAMSTTVMILRLDAATPVEIRTRFQQPPPTIVIEFPRQRVMGSLPERSTLQDGAIRTILTQYDSGTELQPSRVIRSLHIILSAHYAYRVRSEAGRIIVAIDHPSSVGSRTMEVGLAGGTIIGALGPRPLSERFRAMQSALESAVPARAVPSRPAAAAQPRTAPVAVGIRPVTPARSSRSSRPSDALLWWTVAVAALAAGILWWMRAARRQPPLPTGGRLPSGVTLIDGLIWQAFERQGYQLVKEVERAQPSVPLRLIAKDGSKAVLWFVWNGGFFEKRTVEQFAAACREVGVDQGFLVASGSFTVPAQRVAKEHNITLVGREQLMELLSAGATSEYFTRQVEQLHARLEESKETLQQYAGQLDTLRRQRNEASWYLGEERAKSSQLESQLAEAEQQLRRQEGELAQWREEVDAFRKRWEESQWYLGESRARISHLEANLSELQQAAQQLETVRRERDEANWYLGEERQRSNALEEQLASAGQQLTSFQEQLATASERQRSLQRALDLLKRSLGALQTFGERRRKTRVSIPDGRVELLDGDSEHQAIVVGALRDLSSTGIGFEMDRALPEESVRVRLSLPGSAESIESKARVMWQQPVDDQPNRYHCGCRLLGLPEVVRSRISQLIEHPHT